MSDYDYNAVLCLAVYLLFYNKQNFYINIEEMRVQQKKIFRALGVFILCLIVIVSVFFIVGLTTESYFNTKRSRKLKKILHKVTNELNHNKLSYWLDFGTLLGFHRENDLIKGDLDCDLGMKYDDFEQLKPVIDRLRKINVYAHIYKRVIKFYTCSDVNITVDIYKYNYTDNNQWRYRAEREIFTPDSTILSIRL